MQANPSQDVHKWGSLTVTFLTVGRSRAFYNENDTEQDGR